MSDLLPLLQQHGVALVFLCVLLEQAGLPIPAVPALLVAGALAGGGHLSLMQILLAATAASLLADVAWLFAGARYGRRILAQICRISLEPDSCARRTSDIYGRFGVRSLAFAKFIPGYSTLGPAMAGLARTSLPSFLLWDSVGTLLWAGIAVFAGFLFAPAVDDLISFVGAMGATGALVLSIALAAYVGYKWWWRRRFLRQLRMDRVTVAELRRLLDEGRSPLILDVRVEMLEIESGVIPGAVTVRAAGADAVAGESLAGVEEAIVYCSCPNEFSAARVALALKRRGVRKVRPLLGGIDAWIEAGYPLERPGMLRGVSEPTPAPGT